MPNDNDTSIKMQKGDWIIFKSGGVGKVKRIAKDRSWADILCGSWSKRVPNPDEHLTLYKEAFPDA